MAGANTTQCDMVVRQENEDRREYPAAYPSIPRVTIKEEPESEEDQDEREEESKHLVVYHPLPHNDIKEELEEESCIQVLAYEKEASGYQHSETEDLEENNVGRNKQLQGTNTSQEDEDSSDEDLFQSTSRQKVASKPSEEDFDMKMERAFDPRRVKVENTASNMIVDQENSEHREYPIAYAPIPRGIVKEEQASEEDSNECELVAYPPLPHGDIKEEPQIGDDGHDELIISEEVQVTRPLRGKDSPINEATDAAPNAVPLLDGLTSGNENEIGDLRTIKRKRRSKSKGHRSSETMPSSNRIFRSKESSTHKKSKDGVKQLEPEKWLPMECYAGVKGQQADKLSPTEERERKFKCSRCGCSYKRRGALNFHLNNACGIKPQFSCEQCGSKFTQKSSRKKHVTTIHKNDPSKLASFGIEPKVRPELPFKCHKCQRSYKYKGSLTSHLKFDCGLDPTFSCTECDYRAKKKNCLRQHLEQVHNVDRSQLDNCGAAALDVRPVLPFKCELCERTYKTKQNLKFHLKYKCGVDPSLCS